MDKKDAIDCIQALLDVVKLRGCAYIYRRSGGVAELANVLACLKDSEPVVRCKECVHFTDDGITDVRHVCGLKSFSGYIFETGPEKFCSDGTKEVADNG